MCALCVSADADGDQLLNIDAITSQDGKQAADEGVEGVDEDSIKKLKEKGKNLRNKLDEAELKKRNPPKDRKRTVHLVEEDFGDDMDGVEDIKVRSSGGDAHRAAPANPNRYSRAQEKMKRILEKRQAEAQERAGSFLQPSVAELCSISHVLIGTESVWPLPGMLQRQGKLLMIA